MVDATPPALATTSPGFMAYSGDAVDIAPTMSFWTNRPEELSIGTAEVPEGSQDGCRDCPSSDASSGTPQV
jgi:hypothetical protein